MLWTAQNDPTPGPTCDQRIQKAGAATLRRAQLLYNRQHALTHSGVAVLHEFALGVRGRASFLLATAGAIV